MGWRRLYPLAGATALIPLATWLHADDRPSDEVTASGAVGRADLVSGRVGSSSCSGRGCHGKVAPQGTQGSEYTTWSNRDPHATAFLALFDCRSESIQRNLHGARPEAAYLPPYQDPLCMRCHGRADSQEAVRAIGAVDCASSGSLSLAIGPSGVGCEECHGPAEKWLDVHYRDGWRETYPDAAKSMQPLGPTVARAEVCLRCHVGDGLDREVNHDLIAAGHPRLNFEFALYSDRMPRHWDQAVTDAKRLAEGLPKQDPTDSWAVGQVATLRAALDLLAERAGSQSDASRMAPWPEFTEYACFACHHSLVEDGLHYSREASVPGSLDWASWTLPMSRTLIGRIDPALVSSIDSVERLMCMPLPDPARVAEEASRLSLSLGALLSNFDERSFSNRELTDLLVSIADDPRRFEMLTSNWDSAVQLHLAMRALLASEAGSLITSGEATTEDLERLRNQFGTLSEIRNALTFPEDLADSPGSAIEPDPWSEEPRPVVELIRTFLGTLDAGMNGETRSLNPAIAP